jgi:hypothetical protein
MFEVADQLIKHVRLVGVGDSPMPFFDDSSGQNLVPGQVMQINVLELPLVDLGGMDAVCNGSLVGDCEESLQSMPTSHLEVALQLLGL